MNPSRNQADQAEISSLNDFEAFAKSHDLTIDELSEVLEKIWNYYTAKNKIKDSAHLLETFLETERKREKLSQELNCSIESPLFLP
jgi:hypothetical protein